MRKNIYKPQGTLKLIISLSELTEGYNCVVFALLFHPDSFNNTVTFYTKCMN